MKSVIVANWKMNPATIREAKRLLQVTKKAAEKARGVTLIVAPPTIFLRELRKMVRGKRIAFAAQSAHFARDGAHTGEISLRQVKDAHASYVLVGHAERRAAGESNDDTRLKVSAALEARLIPILCIGEKERTKTGDHFAFVREQLHTAFKDIPPSKVSRVIIAYEPVWAIGATVAMSPRDMHEMSIFIRKMLVESHGQSGHAVTVLYGGSVEADNAKEMLMRGDVRGLLVGRASADGANITALLAAVARK